MFRVMDILPGDTYTHVDNGSQIRSWLDHIAMSDVLSESTADCYISMMLHAQITVQLQLH